MNMKKKNYMQQNEFLLCFFVHLCFYRCFFFAAKSLIIRWATDCATVVAVPLNSADSVVRFVMPNNITHFIWYCIEFVRLNQN